MESYCVIHFKEKQEKVKILTFLASETVAKYHVTTDLKEFVAKQFSVTILDNEEVSNIRKANVSATTIQNAIETTIVNHNSVNNIADVVTPSIDTEQQYSAVPIVVQSPIVNRQHRLIETITIKDENDTMEDVAPSTVDNIVAAQSSAATVDPQNWTNMNIGTYVPYRDRMIQPKQERIDEVAFVVDQTNEGNVTETEEDVTEETAVANKDAPSTSSRSRRNTRRSTRSIDDSNNEKCISEQTNVVTDVSSSSRRSGRTTKRPRHSIDDDDEERAVMKDDDLSATRRSERITKQSKYSVQDDSDNESENMSETKKKNNNQRLVTKNKNTSNICKKCGTVCPSYVQKLEHVMRHTKLKKYECLVDGCGFKGAYKCDMFKHCKIEHKSNRSCFKDIELSREQTEEVNTIMKECFPGMPNDRDGTCQVCHQSVARNSINYLYHRDHALQHVDFMLFKCMQEGCQFESKTKNSMNIHLVRLHGKSAIAKFQTYKLTKEQELKIEEMLVKCFPNLGTNNDEVDE